MPYRFDQALLMEWAQKIGVALAILVVTWLLAKAAKWAFGKLVDAVPLFRHHTSSGKTLGASLGTIASLLIWLFGLVAVLQVFDLGGVMGPLQTMLNQTMAFLPRLIGAGVIFFVGLIVARIVRDLVLTFLQTLDLEKWAARGGVDTATGPGAISKAIATVVYVLIVIPVAIVALDTLNLSSVSGPATQMLGMILDAIPRVIGAGVVLGIGYVIARFVGRFLEELLPQLGVDRAIASLDALPAGTSVSKGLSRVAQIAIVVFAAIAATRLLGFPELSRILDEVLALGGRVLFGTVVIVAGYVVSNLLARLVSGGSGSETVATIAKWSGFTLFAFMGLQFMGVGEDIVRLAFGAIVIGGAAAAAIAFGLGGRDAAAKALEDARVAAQRQRDANQPDPPRDPGKPNPGPKGAPPAQKAQSTPGPTPPES